MRRFVLAIFFLLRLRHFVISTHVRISLRTEAKPEDRLISTAGKSERRSSPALGVPMIETR